MAMPLPPHQPQSPPAPSPEELAALAGAATNPEVAQVREYGRTHHACETVVVCAQLESDLADLSAEYKLTKKATLYGSGNPLGRKINIAGQRYSVIGVFRERVNTFGQTEISEYSAIIPISFLSKNFRRALGLLITDTKVSPGSQG